MKNKLEKETLKIMLEGAKNKIVITDKGCFVYGEGPWVAKKISNLIYEMRVRGMNESMLKEAITHGLDAKVEKNEKSSKELEKELEKLINNLFELLTKDLEKALGDE